MGFCYSHANILTINQVINFSFRVAKGLLTHQNVLRQYISSLSLYWVKFVSATFFHFLSGYLIEFCKIFRHTRMVDTTPMSFQTSRVTFFWKTFSAFVFVVLSFRVVRFILYSNIITNSLLPLFSLWLSIFHSPWLSP